MVSNIHCVQVPILQVIWQEWAVASLLVTSQLNVLFCYKYVHFENNVYILKTMWTIGNQTRNFLFQKFSFHILIDSVFKNSLVI